MNEYELEYVHQPEVETIKSRELFERDWQTGKPLERYLRTPHFEDLDETLNPPTIYIVLFRKTMTVFQPNISIQVFSGHQ